MADDPLSELLASPLESTGGGGSEAGSGSAGGAGGWPWFIAAMALGALVVFAGYSLARVGEPAATQDPTTTTTTTTTEPADPEAARLPAGYVPVDERFGARVERVLARPDGLFVTISTVVVAGIDPSMSAPFPGGTWDLVLTDGTRSPSVEESTAGSTPGYTTIRFDPGDLDPEMLASIEYTGVAHHMFESLSATGAAPVMLPADGSEVPVDLDGDGHRLGEGATLVLEDLVMSVDGGSMSWRLDGHGGSTATVGLWGWALVDGVEIARLDVRSGDDPFFIGGFGFFDGSITSRVAREGGELLIQVTDGSRLPDGVEATFEFHGDLIWVSYTPTSVTIPIGNAPVVVVGG
jgi:hypothetical protein